MIPFEVVGDDNIIIYREMSMDQATYADIEHRMTERLTEMHIDATALANTASVLTARDTMESVD